MDAVRDYTCARTKSCSNVSTIPVRRSTEEPAARTLATGLANQTFPFIRYDLGDQVISLPERCECGCSFARIADIAGRRDDDFRYQTTVVPAIAFRHALGTDPRVYEYQVTQTPAGADILVVGSPDVDGLTSSVVGALRRHGVSEPEVKIRVVDRLLRHQGSGKLKRFIALVDESADLGEA